MTNTNLKTRLGSKVQAILEPAAMQTELTAVDSDYLALHSNVFDIIKENLKSQPLSFQLFDIVKSPTGGSTVFSVPGLSGDDAEKELSGIILDYTTPRAYWDTPDPVEGTPPTCMSHNSIMSHDGKPCIRCPYNDFGSKNGESNAKACKESVMVFLLRPDNILPLVVRIPVTSKSRFLRCMTRLLSKLTPISGVVTKITLEKATNKDGQPYALFNFETTRILEPEKATSAKEYAKQFMGLINVDELAVSEISK